MIGSPHTLSLWRVKNDGLEEPFKGFGEHGAVLTGSIDQLEVLWLIPIAGPSNQLYPESLHLQGSGRLETPEHPGYVLTQH
jgi:hypothetical protein